MGLEAHLGEGFLTTRVADFINWGRKNSLWPLAFGTACCAIELMSTMVARYDMARFGAEVVRFSPRQSDLLIVGGRVVAKMMPVLQTIYRQMPEPKWVISMGACASSGGEFDTYAVIQGVDQFIPVDVYIPGCPPRPEGLLEAVMRIQEQIEKEKAGDYRSDRAAPLPAPATSATPAARCHSGRNGCNGRNSSEGGR